MSEIEITYRQRVCACTNKQLAMHLSQAEPDTGRYDCDSTGRLGCDKFSGELRTHNPKRLFGQVKCRYKVWRNTTKSFKASYWSIESIGDETVFESVKTGVILADYIKSLKIDGHEYIREGVCINTYETSRKGCVVI